MKKSAVPPCHHPCIRRLPSARFDQPLWPVALGGIGLAVGAALPAIGVPVAILSFAGWAARRFTDRQTSRSLCGASMFVDAQRRLDWLQPTA